MSLLQFLNNGYFAGKVGIGTNSPGAKLHILSSNTSSFDQVVKLSGQVGVGGGPAVFFKTSGADADNRYGVKLGAVRSDSDNGSSIFKIQQELSDTAGNLLGLTDTFTINQYGNVGIGTTSPSTRLEVAASATTSVDIAHFSNSNDVVKIKHALDGLGSGRTSIFDASNNEDIRLSAQSNSWFNAGDVGIGTTGPSEKLEVAGNIKIQAALLSNQENTDVDTGTETVANVAIATYTAAFFDFVVKKTTNVRSGTVYACHDGTNVEFTETSTNDLGDTSDVTLSVDISGTNMRLLATVTSNDWSVKSLIRAI